MTDNTVRAAEECGSAMESSPHPRVQKPLVYNRFLAYFQEQPTDLDDEAFQTLREIQTQLGRAVLLSELRPGAALWTIQLNKYLRLYGFNFPKEDHVALIKVLYSLCTLPDLEPWLVCKFGQTMNTLLKKKELLSPDDLELPWRPLFYTYQRFTYSSEKKSGMLLSLAGTDTTLKAAIRRSRIYFPKSATREMMEEWHSMMCPFDAAMREAMEYMELFLPTHHPDMFKLWLPELLNLWEGCHNSPGWENKLFLLLSRLAYTNPGCMDWEPYIPRFFSCFLGGFSLPVSYKNRPSSKPHIIDVNAAVTFIVHTLGKGSSSQEYLEKMLAALESYFHPANYGRWYKRLQDFLLKLTHTFVDRLHKERYRKPSCHIPLHPVRLADSDITRFVLSVKPVALASMFSLLGPTDPAQTLHSLAILRPRLIIPPMLERLYVALEMVTEPHRLTAAMQCMVSVLRIVLSGGVIEPPWHITADKHDETEDWSFPEGPSHLLPLLMATLPGMDPNDLRKCIVTFHFISTAISLVPLVDCSALADKVDNDEVRAVYEATAGFEDFMLRFLDQTFALVESSILLESMAAWDKPTSEENLMDAGITATFSTLLTQSSLPVFQAALKKVCSFMSGRILETKVAGKFVANICRAFSKVRPEVALKVFLPPACSTALSLLESDDVLKEENLDAELLFNLHLISQVVRCPGNNLVPYQKCLQQVLDRTLHLASLEGSKMAGKILQHMLKGLSSTMPSEYRSVAEGFDRSSEEHDYMKDWGKPGNIRQLHINWYVPSEAEIRFAQDLIHRYLGAEMERIELHIKTTEDEEGHLTREELRCSLSIMVNCFLGCSALLPFWDEEEPEVIDTWVPRKHSLHLRTQCSGTVVTTKSGGNVRKEVLHLLHCLQKKMLQEEQDDTKSLTTILNMYDLVLFHGGETRDECDSRWKSFQLMKRVLENRLVRHKKHSRAILIDRVQIQHESRLIETTYTTYTRTHLGVLQCLFDMATSHYSEIRSQAQILLNCCFAQFSYSYLTLLPRMVTCLCDSSCTHEQLKGAMYVALGHKHKSILVRRNWQALSQLWPALVRSTHSEKPSIITLLEAASGTIFKYLDSFNIKIQMSDETSAAAIQLLGVVPGVPCPSTDQVIAARAKLEVQGKENEHTYYSLVETLVDSVNSGELHWRHESLAYGLLCMLVRSDVLLPAGGVRLILRALIHDNLVNRKNAIHGLACILRQLKRPHPKCLLDPYLMDVTGGGDRQEPPNPGFRSDNQWLQYSENTVPKSEQEWDELRYVDKSHFGYNAWPKYLEVYAPSSEQPSLDRTSEEMSPAEAEIYNFFRDQSNVDRLITFLSLEDRKGKDKFESKRCRMFKGLFRNYGDAILDKFIPHLERLVGDKSESGQRCASEIMAGLMRAYKHWPYAKVEGLWQALTPIIRTALSNVTTETMVDWGTCCATASVSRDPNRIHWFLELLMEDPLREEEGAFVEASRLYMLQGALGQQQWRVESLLERLVSYLHPHLAHSYQNVRERISSVLVSIYVQDVTYSHGPAARGPHAAALAKELYPQLAMLKETDPSGASPSLSEEEKKSALLLLKTVSKWITGSILRTYQGAETFFLRYLPILCALENYETDPEVGLTCSSAIACLAQARLLPTQLSCALEVVKEVASSPSWHCRASIVEYLQVLVFSNLCLLPSQEDWMASVRTTVMGLLGDPNLEVRIKAANVLGGMLHCKFIPMSPDLLATFKANAAVPLPRRETNSNALIRRHSGVLGLCAVVGAHPYSVPDIVPDIIVVLGDHLHDPQPIPAAIKKTLNEFHRTHQDNWQEHKQKFTDDQLGVLVDLVVSPSYYA